MTMRHSISALAVAASLLCLPMPTIAQDAIKAPAQKTIGGSTTTMTPSLAVLNSAGATLEGGKLTMNGVSANSIVFADRPVRAAGHVLTSEFIKQWDEGNDSFAKDPPNATISVLGRDGDSIKDAVVVLKKPTLEGQNLTFEVSVLEGDLMNADGPASLFIDWFAVRGGYGHPAVWHGGWYGHGGYGWGVATGAAIGAAAASAYRAPYYYRPYYPPPACGYYPYPPCY